jgi:adenylate kinase
MFRDSADVGVAAGLQAKAYMDRGELVPDDLVVKVVEERFGNPGEVEPGFVLDGFPRTSQQARELDRILGNNPLDLVIDLEVPTEVVVERMRARGRDDDTEESIRRRLALYDTETKPLVDFYRERSLLIQIDGLGTEDEVFESIVDAIMARFAAS